MKLLQSQGQKHTYQPFLTHLVFPHRDENFRSPITNQGVLRSKLNGFVEKGKSCFSITTPFDSLRNNNRAEALTPRLRETAYNMTLNAPFLHILIVLRSLGGSPLLFGSDTRLNVSCSFSDNKFPGHTCDHIQIDKLNSTSNKQLTMRYNGESPHVMLIGRS